MSSRASVRPWRKELTPVVNNDPLIPTQYVDSGQQRLIAVSLFAILQAYKVHALLVLRQKEHFHEEETFFAIKYTVLDALFAYLLPVFRVPWLTYSNPVAYLLILLLAIINFYVGAHVSTPLWAIFFSWTKVLFDREVSISGATVWSNRGFDGGSHISGRYTVQILPESTALLNPSQSRFCIEHSYSPVELTVRLNATEPSFLQLTKYNLESMEPTQMNFTKRDLRKLRLDHSEDLEDTKLSYIGLSVSSPGLYRLTRLIDTASDMDVRIQASDVIIPNCPGAYILGSEGDENPNRCIGAPDTPKLFVNGVPPLKIKYGRSIKGLESRFSVQSVQPDDYTSPLVHGKSEEGDLLKSGLQWALSSTVEVDMDTTLSTTGEWLYTIDEVEDGFGNLVNYTEIYQDRHDARLLESKKLSYGFVVHPRPQVRFRDCSLERPVTVAKGRSVNLPLVLMADDKEGPFEVTLQRSEDQIDGPVSSVENYLLQSSKQSLPVKEPGIYKLVNIKSNFCPGEIVESSSCLVYSPPEPTAEMKFEEIEDKCAGIVGVNVDMIFSGTAPFQISYRLIKDGHVVQTLDIDSDQSRKRIQLKPNSAGRFEYQFFALRDSIYHLVPLNVNYRLNQEVQLMAGVSFGGRFDKKCCSGDSMSVPVYFRGTPPFTFTYEIIQGGIKRKEYTVRDINEMQYTIQTEPLVQGGSYTVSLLTVSDQKGCLITVKESDAKIEVRRQRPSAGFIPIDGSFNVKALQGQQIHLPLRISGEGPWHVSYLGPDSTAGEITVYDGSKSKITVNNPGKYILTGIKDNYCSGTVTDNNEMELGWLPKPQILVREGPAIKKKESNYLVKKDICEGDDDSLDISLEGE